MIIIPEAVALHANNNGSLPLPITLSPAATTATIVPGLKSYYMLSIGQLCDDGFNLLLNKHNMYAMKEK